MFAKTKSIMLQGDLDFLLEEQRKAPNDLHVRQEVMDKFEEFKAHHKDQSWAQVMISNYTRMVFTK